MNILNGKKLAASVLIPVIVGAIANKNTKEDYWKLKKPSFSPPGWVTFALGLNYSIWSLNKAHS